MQVHFALAWCDGHQSGNKSLPLPKVAVERKRWRAPPQGQDDLLIRELKSLIGGVGDLDSAVLGSERIGWVFQLGLAVSDSH